MEVSVRLIVLRQKGTQNRREDLVCRTVMKRMSVEEAV